jgi:hypothetical protein
MTNVKIVGKQKEDLLKVLTENLKGNEINSIRDILIDQGVISGKGRSSNSVVFTNKNGEEFYPTLSWKPLKNKVKIGEKSKMMEEFIEDFDELKYDYLNEITELKKEEQKEVK